MSSIGGIPPAVPSSPSLQASTQPQESGVSGVHIPYETGDIVVTGGDPEGHLDVTISGFGNEIDALGLVCSLVKNKFPDCQTITINDTKDNQIFTNLDIVYERDLYLEQG